MANTRYENIVIQNKLTELLKTGLSMSQFLTVDTSLQEDAGMKKNVHVYSSTGTGADVTEGNGNTTAIEMSYTNVPYTVGTYQARFIYTDEDMMTDPFLVESGLTNLSKDIVNDFNTKAITEFYKGTKKVYTGAGKGYSFDNFADALAELNLEDADENGYFAIISVKDRAELRKALKDELQYVEAYARTGYVGSVCGIPVYTSKIATDGKIVIANKEAVTAFMKKNTEVEQDRDVNKRINYVYSRNVKVVALTNDTKVVQIIKGAQS